MAEGSGTRLQQAAAVLGDERWLGHVQQAEVRAWGFAESAYPLALDTVAAASTRGQATDIGRVRSPASLEAVAERERVQGVVLFSDGGHNLGRDPGATERGTGRAHVRARRRGGRKRRLMSNS